MASRTSSRPRRCSRPARRAPPPRAAAPTCADTPLVTIDGEDARDFDDAVFAEPDGDGWRVLVAIADVAHYVPAGSALDREAWARGNSVYFPDRVVPMLPEALSNGWCSLRPEEDRGCLFVEMRFDGQGRKQAHAFGRRHHALRRAADLRAGQQHQEAGTDPAALAAGHVAGSTAPSAPCSRRGRSAAPSTSTCPNAACC